jgi:hypothetical protein
MRPFTNVHGMGPRTTDPIKTQPRRTQPRKTQPRETPKTDISQKGHNVKRANPRTDIF